MQVVSVVPRDLVEMATQTRVDKNGFLSEIRFGSHLMLPCINLLKMKNENYYWIINNDKQELKASPKWTRDLDPFKVSENFL